MSYRVVYSEAFTADLDRHLVYLDAQQVGRQVIDRWFTRLYRAVDSLYFWPTRHPIDEIQSRATGRETRKLNVGDYLIFYQVNPDTESVLVVSFMHGAKKR